jgi:hypothetical protein
MLAAARHGMARRGGDALGCGTPCHASSEPGLPDGGFSHVAREHGWRAPSVELDELDALPRALRRLAGVGCTACHGPGSIPEEGAGWAILASDVCAVCHDAPPRYGHALALRASAMARSDADPRTRASGCAGCHTTAGFLARIAAREATAVPEDAPLGIACAACHAPHAAHERALVRLVPAPAGFEDEPRDRICLPCHAPSSEGVRAAQATFVLGRGAIDLRTGAALSATSAHAGLGCLGCHGAPRASGLVRGAAHAFAVDEARCSRTGCHTSAPSRTTPAGIAERVRRLLERGGPTHEDAMVVGADSPLAWNLALLRMDRAAWVHGPGYAEALIETLEGVPTGPADR